MHLSAVVCTRDFEEPWLGFVGGRVVLFDPTDFPITIQELDRREDVEPHAFVPAGLIHGANFAFRREVLEAIGGFDDEFGSRNPVRPARTWTRSPGPRRQAGGAHTTPGHWSTITTGARRGRTRCGFAGCTTRRAAPTTRSASWIGACAPDTWAPGCASSPPSAGGAPRGSSGGALAYLRAAVARSSPNA